MKILHLTLKKKWFDAISVGEKRVEFRAMKPYWIRRLVKSAGVVIIMRSFNEIHFRNGYDKDAPFMRVQHIETDVNFEKKRFEIKLGKVLERRPRRTSINSPVAARKARPKSAPKNNVTMDWYRGIRRGLRNADIRCTKLAREE